MGKVEELEMRVALLESAFDAAVGVLNKLIEDIYEPEYVKKIDRLVAHEE